MTLIQARKKGRALAQQWRERTKDEHMKGGFAQALAKLHDTQAVRDYFRVLEKNNGPIRVGALRDAFNQGAVAAFTESLT